MKIAFAGKGGVGKTTLTAWTADYLARTGRNVWMVDADTALSLGQASGLAKADLPVPLVQREDVIRERIGSGMLSLTPEVDDLPEKLAVQLPVCGPPIGGGPIGRKHLLVMGALSHAGGGCACEANALLKAVLAHLVLDRQDWVLVDLEAGVEHLGRGTVAHADGVIVVSEPSWRGLETAAEVSRMSTELGLHRQVLALNKTPQAMDSGNLPTELALPPHQVTIPSMDGLAQKQLLSPSVLELPEEPIIFETVTKILEKLQQS